MKVKGRAPGFKYIYQTDIEDVAVVRFCSEGIGGLLGLKRLEWIISRNDDSIVRCFAELSVKAPVWAIENGNVAAVEAELHRWCNPILYEAMRAWE